MAVEEKLDYKKLQNLPLFDPNDPSRKYKEAEEKVLRELVTYEFSNLEEPGLILKFPYGKHGNKHVFTFMHGGQYTIPRFIARHVESKSTPIWQWRPNGMGGMEKKKVGTKSRFQMREVY